MKADQFFRRAARIKAARLALLLWSLGNVIFAIYNIVAGAGIWMSMQVIMSIACVSLATAPVDDNSRSLLEQFDKELEAHGIRTNAARLLRDKVVLPTATSPGYRYEDGLVVTMEDSHVEHR